MLKLRGTIVVPALAILQVASLAQSPRFSTGSPGVAADQAAHSLFVFLPIINGGTGPASNVRVTAVTLNSAAPSTPNFFPVALGDIGVGQSAIFSTAFSSNGLSVGTQYLLTVQGLYTSSGLTSGFAVNRYLSVPPSSAQPFCSLAFPIPPAHRCDVCIDLSRDANGDGLPDQLVAEIDQIRHRAPSEQTAAIVDMVSRLPYSQKTLDLQAQAAVASLQLDVCDLTDTEKTQLGTKVQGFFDAMITDPGYARAQESTQAILAKDFEISLPVSTIRCSCM